MRKLQSQGVHHITLVGADRQTSIDFWEGVLGMPFVFEQPNLDSADREPPLLRPGRRAPDHRLHERGAQARPDAHADRPGLRAPHRVLALAGDVPPGGRAARRARHPHSGVKDRGFMDSIYFEDPLGPADRARVVPLRAAVRLHARRRAARGAQAPRRARRLQHRPGAPRRRDRGARRCARGRRCPTTARRRTPTATPVTVRPPGGDTWPPTRSAS